MKLQCPVKACDYVAEAEDNFGLAFLLIEHTRQQRDEAHELWMEKMRRELAGHEKHDA